MVMISAVNIRLMDLSFLNRQEGKLFIYRNFSSHQGDCLVLVMVSQTIPVTSLRDVDFAKFPNLPAILYLTILLTIR